jgi:CcmD family protein
MRFLRVCLVTLLLTTSIGGSIAAQSQPAQPEPQRQDEFVPIDELPPEEQMPAAPMVVAAYAFVWVAFLAYVFTIVKRMRKVEGDLRALEQSRR